MTETEKFRTERLVARPWQIEDLPLAMELWGAPAVTALKSRDRQRSAGTDHPLPSDAGNGEAAARAGRIGCVIECCNVAVLRRG
jgi:hypothetical protein